jgi:hypothetical protein
MIKFNSKNQVTEKVEKSSPNKEPPVLLVMRRKSIRQLSNGQKVALYYVDKLKKYVTVPFDSKGSMSLTVEDFVEEDFVPVIQHLQEIVSNNNTKRLVFEDGSNMLVDKFVANVVLEIYNNLNDSNKEKLSEMAEKSKEDFKQIVEFARKYKG